MFKRVLIFLTGIFILTFGVTLTLQANLGTGAFDSINFALAERFGVSMSTMITLIGVLSLCLTALLLKRMPRILAFITAFIIGFCIDFWLPIAEKLPNETMVERTVLFGAALIILTIGISLYLLPQLPTNPIDEVVLAIAERFGMRIGYAKLIVDSSCFVLAIVLGGPIGVGTIILTVVIGPMIVWTQSLLRPYLFPKPAAQHVA